MYVFPKKVTLLITAKQNVRYDLLHRCVTPQPSLLLFRISLRHDDWNLLRHSFSLKGLVQSSNKSQRKKKSLQPYRANALCDNCMENITKCSHPKMTCQNDGQDERLTGQVHDQAGHCPLTGRHFEPCTSLTESKIYNNRLSEAKIKKLHILVKCEKITPIKAKRIVS